MNGKSPQDLIDFCELLREVNHELRNQAEKMATIEILLMQYYYEHDETETGTNNAGKDEI